MGECGVAPAKKRCAKSSMLRLPPLRLAWPALAAGVALAAAGALVAALLSDRRVRQQHADTEHREETR